LRENNLILAEFGSFHGKENFKFPAQIEYPAAWNWFRPVCAANQEVKSEAASLGSMKQV
jgi:hypothetical protein